MKFSKSVKELTATVKSFRSIFYVGNNFECPCCNGHFKIFLTFGVNPRPNAQCPKCGSLERHRYFWLYYQNQTTLFSANLKVLHFAPEYVFQRNFKLYTNLDYISADLSSPLADFQMDITDIKFKDNSFDVILCNDVLEHVADDYKAMSELYRVLKPTGWAIIQAPVDKTRKTTYEDTGIISPKEREKHFGRHDHVRLYGLDYKERLCAAGFQVKVDSYINKLNADTIKRYNLTTDRDIYYCVK